MDFTETPQVQMIREAMRDIGRRFGPPYWREKDAKRAFPFEFWEALGEGGWTGALVPEEYGGAGLRAAEMAVIVEEVVQAGAGGTGGILLISNLVFGTMAILHHGSEAQKRKYLPMMSDGKSVFTMALTEPDAGSNALETKTMAVSNGDGWILNGSKVFITNVQMSPLLLILSRTERFENVKRRTDGMSTFLLDNPSSVPGVQITPIDKLGLNALQTNQLFFQDVRLEQHNLLGNEGQGWKQILDVLNPERIVTASIAVGLGNLAIETAVNYAKERRLFGRPIGANQGLAFPLAAVKAELEAARALNHKAAWLFDAGLPCAAEVNMAKYLATEACWKACDWAVQAHGGYGYTRDYDVERYLREARLMRIAPVTSQMALNFISEHVLGLPRSY